MARPSFSEVFGSSAFLGTPARRFFVGRRFCYWQDHARAFGTIMWGKPLEADIAEMIPFFEIGVDARFAGHASFVDGRSLEAIDVLAFGKLLAYLVARQHAWGPNIGRQAILHPGGFVGVVVAGALKVARPPHPFECFEEGAAAFSWCGVADLHDDVEALRAASDTPEIVRGVRTVLRERGLVGAAETAKALGLSQRTLQRRLEEAGSSLREARDHHLSEQIEHLLGGTDLDLDAIAAAVGLSSASHLVTHFRSTHGTTPGAWRTQRRP
ncbi:MAG: helix-turn-helix domain-containing protein [Myxococcota bacterium]|nr:helix-turn-helix domain-containing protein [Myxococcota bacterium]